MRVARYVVLLALLWSAPARAEHGAFGLGLILGQPTGVTGAFGLSDHTAIDGAVGLGWIDDHDFYLHVEFDYYLPTLMHGSAVDLSAYLGIGAFFFAHSDGDFGARAPFGLSLDFHNAPIEIFLEAA